MGKFGADRLVLRKGSEFDADTGKYDADTGHDWVVTDSMNMVEGVTWLVAFTTNPGDEKLEVEADGEKIIIDLPNGRSSIHDDKAKVTVNQQWSGKCMALVEVPSHFRDVWSTFQEKSKEVIEEMDPANWAGSLEIAWQSAWDLWDIRSVYTIVFVQGMGNTGVPHKVQVIFTDGGPARDGVERVTKADTAWLATSVPLIKGGSHGSFKVRADSMETEDEMLYDKPSTHLQRCKLLKPAEGDDKLKVFVAAFLQKEPFDNFKAHVTEDGPPIWDAQKGEWLFDEITKMCSKFHMDIEDERNRESGAGAMMSPSSFEPGIPENRRLSLWIIIVKSCVASALLLCVVWCFLCRAEGPGIDTNTSDGVQWMEAQNAHGQAWETDAVSGGFERFDMEGPTAKDSLTGTGGA